MIMKEFWEKYRNYILVIGVFSFLIHGAKLNSAIVGIDTEDLIHLQKDFYTGWAETGRYGLVFLKQLFANLQFQPYFAGLMTVLLLGVGVFSFICLWSKTSGEKHWGLLMGGFLWISHPIITEQLYFSLQSMEICLGILMTAVALYWTGLFAERKKWYFYVGRVSFLLITFSMYQVFVPFYIYGVASLVLLKALKHNEEDENRGKEIGSVCRSVGKRLLQDLLPYVIVFFTAFLKQSSLYCLC